MFKKKGKSMVIIFSIIFAFVGFVFIIYQLIVDYNKPLEHSYSSDRKDFPDNFLWGTATASYQVEGGNFNSDWWRFEQTEGSIKNNYSAEIAADHYNRYEEDFDLMQKLNLNTYRFSVEWSRIEPEKGNFNHDEIEHYRKMLNELEKRDIKPMVTLWHFSLPQWFEDEGGWEKKSNIKYFERYVDYVSYHLSNEVEFWVTMNEPTAHITGGYIMGKWPPGKEKPLKSLPVFNNMIKGHKAAYDIIHGNDNEANVGMAQFTSFVTPKNEKNLLENLVAYTADKVSNHLFVREVYDELDFLGMHYYFRQTISTKIIKNAIFKDPEEVESEDMDRSYYPQGLYEILMEFKKYDLPIYITELGVQDAHEVSRDQFLNEHLGEVYYAIENGVDIRGVYYWSLLDNFEWSEGYGPKFGLVSVNEQTQERNIKDTSWEYAHIAKCNCIEKEDESE